MGKLKHKATVYTLVITAEEALYIKEMCQNSDGNRDHIKRDLWECLPEINELQKEINEGEF